MDTSSAICQSDIADRKSLIPLPLPAPRVPVTVRAGTLDDLPFMDRLQKPHGKQVGWMPTATLAGKVGLGHVLVAESGGGGGAGDGGGERVGYCIGNDRYFKRDDVGIVYQMNVDPAAQRGLVGATLLRALFDRSAYGCRLYCCWCAQDIAANRFWEAMGFVPLAFRAGSRAKDRVHIFWQRRVRAGDATTPWWFPSKTDGGAMREDRLVLPIPPGVRWDDPMPRLPASHAPALTDDGTRQIVRRKATPAPGMTARPQPPTPRPRGGVQFGPPGTTPIVVAAANAGTTMTSEDSSLAVRRPRKATVKCDPTLIAAARELRDRWLEQVNAGPSRAVAGKYDVGRRFDADVTIEIGAVPLAIGPGRLLPAA